MLEVPEKLGRHEIVAQLGEGGMANVYLAVQSGPYGSAKLVVIKQLKASSGHEREFLEMFVDEARIAMKLSHPNVVSTFDFVADGDDFHLKMEFLDGKSLLQTLRKVGRENMPLDLHVWILTQVLAGLGYAQALRDFDGTPLDIVHRDVTPSNIILTYAGGVKLVDFGIAKVAGALSITQSGIMKGKLGYAAPEQCLGKATTASSDLYSVGVMLWEAMAGRRRNVGDSPAAIFRARIQGSEAAIEEVRPNASPLLVQALNRALAPRPEDRYATALEFQKDLEAYLATAPRSSYDAQALSDFLKQHFAEVAEALHRKIDARIAAVGQSLPGAKGSGPSPSRVPSAHSSDTPKGRIAPLVTATSSPEKQNTSRAPGATPARLAAIGVVLTIAGMVAWRAQSRPSPQPTLATPRSAPVPSPTIVVLPSRPIEEAREAPQSSRPARAQAAPLLANGNAGHSLNLVSKHSTAPARSSARPAGRTTVASPSPQAPGKATAAARPVVPSDLILTSEPPENAVVPGMDLTPRARSLVGSRHIDEKGSLFAMRRVCPFRRSLSFSAIALAVVLAPHAFAADEGNAAIEQARQHFGLGVQFYKDGDLDAALAEFNKAYESRADYRVLYNIGQVQAERHDNAAAIKVFHEYLKMGGNDIADDRRKVVERSLRDLSARVGSVTVTTNLPDGEILVDGVVVATLPLTEPLAVNAGIREINVRRAGQVATARRLVVAGGESVNVELTVGPALSEGAPPALSLSPATKATSASHTHAWVAFGTAAVLGAASVTFGLLARRADHDLGTDLDHFPGEAAAIQQDRSQLKTWAALTEGFGAAALIAAGVGTYFLIWGASGAEEPRPSVRTARVMLLPSGAAFSFSQLF